MLALFRSPSIPQVTMESDQRMTMVVETHLSSHSHRDFQVQLGVGGRASARGSA